MTSRPEQLVTGAAALVAAVGRWPSFYDADVLRIRRVGEDLEVLLRIFENRHHCVTFELRGVMACSAAELAMDGSDALDEVRIERTPAGLLVTFEALVEPDRTWIATCREMAVVDVTPV